jgi:hypothetical protein
MRRVIVAMAAVLVPTSVFGFPTPAGADAYPFCLSGGESDALQCDYENLEQCQASSSGGLGDCIVNPAYIANPSQQHGVLGSHVRRRGRVTLQRRF